MGRYYEKLDDGAVIPRHYVPLVSRPDDIRPTRISDVRKMWKEERLVVPSVTTVLNVLDKAALNNWKIDQHLVIAASVSTDDYFGDGGFEMGKYIAEIKRLTELEMDKAPKAGTDFHGLMESYVLGKLPESAEGYELCFSVLNEICKQTDLSVFDLDKLFPEVNLRS